MSYANKIIYIIRLQKIDLPRTHKNIILKTSMDQIWYDFCILFSHERHLVTYYLYSKFEVIITSAAQLQPKSKHFYAVVLLKAAIFS